MYSNKENRIKLLSFPNFPSKFVVVVRWQQEKLGLIFCGDAHSSLHPWKKIERSFGFKLGKDNCSFQFSSSLYLRKYFSKIYFFNIFENSLKIFKLHFRTGFEEKPFPLQMEVCYTFSTLTNAIVYTLIFKV